MSITKGIGFLLLFYLIISGSVVWRVRQICLLQLDECGYYDLLDTVFSSRLITTAIAMFVGLMVFVTAHVISRLRNNTLGIEQEEPPKRRFKVNGNLVAFIVFALYLGGALMVLTRAAGNLTAFHEDKLESFIWTMALVAQGPLILPLVLWHLNDYLVKPASKILLFLLPCLTLIPIFWAIRAAFLTI
jgi:hypothetical protein